MVDSRPVMEQYNELLRILGQYIQHGLKMDESIFVSSIIDKLPPSWKDFKYTLKHGKDDLSLIQLGGHLRIEESLRAQESDKGKGKEVDGPSMNMTNEGKSKNNKQNKGKKRGFKEHNSGSGSNKKPKLECWKCGKTCHFKRDCHSGNKKNANAGGSGKGSNIPKTMFDAIAWWIDSGATTHVCKDRCWFKTYELVEDGSVLYMGDDHFALVHGKGGFGCYNNGMFMLNLNKVFDDSDSIYMPSSSTVVNSSLWHARLGHVHYKRMLEMSKDDLITAIDENLEKYKGGEYYDPVFFQSVGIIHETTAPYIPQQNGVSEMKSRAFKEMVNYMLSYSVLSEGAVVRLLDPKIKTLGEKGVDCIFVRYAEHSKAYRDDHSDDVPSEIPKPQKGKESGKLNHMKEAIDNEIGSIMENDTWVLSDLPPGCKWIFKRMMKVDGTIDKLLLALTSIHNIVIHQMDVKTAFLNGDLDEEVYMKQPKGFVMP
ncbi:zinc finger, CCHC-type containing protein, partial [Tanacetum coccineum]